MAKAKATYMGFTAGETVFFNGQQVKLLRPVAEHEGHTWRVKVASPKDVNDGEIYNINPARRHLLSRSIQ